MGLGFNLWREFINGSAGFRKTSFVARKLGNPKMRIEDDPRLDPRLLAALKNYGLLEQGEPLPVTVKSPIPDLIDFCNQAEKGWEEENAKIYEYVKPNPEVAVKTVVIRGVDDNEIKLFIHRPKSSDS